MDTQAIIEAVQNIFIGADERDWELCRASFADHVMLDYQSMTGDKPAITPADDIIQSWRNFLPGFHATHHQLGNFVVKQHGADLASAFFYGTATHYLPNDSGDNIWTVVGTYNTELELQDGQWKVKGFKFNLKYTDGNPDLPKMI